MAFARIEATLLHYRLSGHAGRPAIALAHSLGTDLRIWDEVVERLAPQYRLIAYDLRGHGLSDAPPGDYSLEDHVGDLLGLLDHLGIERVALAGISVGGLVAQGFAVRQPARLSGLVLCDTAPRLGSIASWTARLEAVSAGGMAAIADAVAPIWFPDSFPESNPTDYAGWRNMLLRTSPIGYAGTCATLRDTDLSPLIGSIAVPTLVVAGELDRSTPPETVRQCANLIPGARFEVIPGAGHIPSIDRPEALVMLMHGFFEEIGHV